MYVKTTKKPCIGNQDHNQHIQHKIEENENENIQQKLLTCKTLISDNKTPFFVQKNMKIFMIDHKISNL